MAVISIEKARAEFLGIHSSEQAPLIVKACLFLGYGDIFIHELVANPLRAVEAAKIVESALELGLNKNDEIQIFTSERDFSVRRRRRTKSDDHS